MNATLERFVTRNRGGKNIENYLRRRQDDFSAQRERWIADLTHSTPAVAENVRVGIAALTNFIATVNDCLPLLQGSASVPPRVPIPVAEQTSTPVQAAPIQTPPPPVSASTGLVKLAPAEPQLAHSAGASPAGRGASGAAGELLES